MDNFTSQNNFSFDQNNLLWAKIFNPNYPQPYSCLSTCTTLSQTSHSSPPCFDISSVKDDYSEFSSFPPNSPLQEVEDERSIPDDSACALDGSFDDRLQDDFDDLINNNSETGYYEEEELSKYQQFKEGFFISDFKPQQYTRPNKNKNKELYYKAWEQIKILFGKYINTPQMVGIVKRELSRNHDAQKYTLKEIYKNLNRQTKKMTRNDIMTNKEENNQENYSFQAFILKIVRNLFINFVNEQAEYSIDGLKANDDLKQVMIEILMMISRSF